MLAALMVTVPIVDALVAGSVYSSECNVWLIIRGWLGGSHLMPECTNITLAGDIPSLVLWIGSTTAVFLYERQRRTVLQLDALVVSTGIADSPPSVFAAARLSPKRPERVVVIFGALLLVGYFLHRHVEDDSAFARYLHTDFGTPPELNWWAESGISSWIWILIGVIGATIASMHALMNFEFTLMVWKAIRDQNLKFNFVPAWISDCHGWEAIRTIWYCVIAGSVVFLTSFAAVSYLVIGGTKSQEFLALVTIVLLSSGVTLNAAMIGLIYRSVRRWFMNACDRHTSSLRTAIVAANSSTDIRHLLTRVALRLETHDLSEVGNFPFSSRWRLIPAGVAFVITNFAVIGALVGWAAK